MDPRIGDEQGRSEPARRSVRWASVAAEWLLLALIASLYAGPTLLDFGATSLQQTGEHNESLTQLQLTDTALRGHRELPLWNPLMLTGFPLAGDLMSHLWHPVATLPVLLLGAVDGMKLSAFLAFLAAGIGQWWFGRVVGLGPAMRLWSAAVFLTSGGLAMYWRSGWYALLLGAAWFPWCFAAHWRALERPSLATVAAAAASVFMVISAGGGYYPVYLLLCLAAMSGFWLVVAGRGRRRSVVLVALSVVVLSAGLSAVVLVPAVDNFRWAHRTVPWDVVQAGAQSIPYALFNYVVHTPAWLASDLLGTAGGWNWFYLGWLPVAALTLVPLALARGEGRRAMVGVMVLLLVILVWMANRNFPVRLLYDTFPQLQAMRFPNRLLVIAASPLLALAGLAMQSAWRRGRAAVAARSWTFGWPPSRTVEVPAKAAWNAAWLLLLVATTIPVFKVNQSLGFARGTLDPQASEVLGWLQHHDASLYAVDLNDGEILWHWLPAAHERGMPVINFLYSRRLDSQAREPGDPRWSASAKYLVYRSDREPGDVGSLVRLRSFEGIEVWHAPRALPYAFLASEEELSREGGPRRTEVVELAARLDGTNRIVVDGTSRGGEERLVVSTSDHPGWELTVDGRGAAIEPVNGYLATRARPGEHRYVFRFRPPLQLAGIALSSATAVFLGAALALPAVRRRVGRRPTSGRSRVGGGADDA